ncbi:hypothetical protein OAS39_08605, partial [Pirellulales bacterium]|nr:hypothetical protein [Pirellulales bacterium]
LENEVMRCDWKVKKHRCTGLTIVNLHNDQKIELTSGYMPRVVLQKGKVLDLSEMNSDGPIQMNALTPDPRQVRGEMKDGGRRISALFRDDASGITVAWSAELRSGSNYVTQSIEVTTRKVAPIESITFLDTSIEDALQVGQVDGSVVTCGNVFFAMEHPLATNSVDDASNVRCFLQRGNLVQPMRTWRYSFVIGVVPQHQLRRGFLYYLERRRARPYKPFLHYNSWYHLNIGRPNSHMTEDECLVTIEFIGRELVKKRHVKLDAFVWDDGWDDFNSLWEFHSDFPNGFRKLRKLGAEYGAAQGVWMSPWGGYGQPKEQRIAFGRSKGYEINQGGFSMAGQKYGAAFREVCLKMMRQHGVVFFKFDGMGVGNSSTGSQGESADDIDAVLDLTRFLRSEDPNLFVSATVGTWASPFWTFYADSIWRQGEDTGFHGSGNGRQQWITYRDMICYDRIVKLGPLYPLNSLMLHGLCIGEREAPGKMSHDEKSVADELWTFFGSGTNLQELYISPHLLTETMWDELASAVSWARANADVLVDTHWIGGNPGIGDVYGWAAWQPRKGIVVLRNPSEKPQKFDLELAQNLELPKEYAKDCTLTSPKRGQRIPELRCSPLEPTRIELEPYEVLIFDAAPVTNSECMPD